MTLEEFYEVLKVEGIEEIILQFERFISMALPEEIDYDKELKEFMDLLKEKKEKSDEILHPDN